MADAVGPRLRILGIRGFLQGEERNLELGETLVVGRSREADLSVRRARKFLERSDRAELMQSERFLSVSRTHVRIHFLHPDLVEVENLSANGTLLDGKRIDRVALTDLKTTCHILALGGGERLQVELAP